MGNGIINMRMRAILRLFDTARGIPIEEEDISAVGREGEYRLLIRPGGRYCLMDKDREALSVTIRVKGYEERVVRFSALLPEEEPPEREIHLIPKKSSRALITVSGILPGIRELTAILTSDMGFRIGSYEGESRILTLLRPIRDAPEQKGYGLMVKEKEFEPIIIEETKDGAGFRIKETPRHPPSPGAIMKRLVYGTTDRNGEYLLRFYRTGQEDCLIRYVTEKGVFFRIITESEGESGERSL